MTRDEYLALHDATDKQIVDTISFAPRKQHPSFLSAEATIVNSLGLNAKLEINYNPQTLVKTFVIVVEEADGPVCRLCVDGTPHSPCGRSHKHALQTAECPRKNLPLSVVDHPTLAGRQIDELFGIFCSMTHIQFTGTFVPPP